jgi:hypothetical protein
MIELLLVARAPFLGTPDLQVGISLLVLCLVLGNCSFQVLQRQCQLIIIDAFGFAAEVRASDLCKKVLELRIAGGELMLIALGRADANLVRSARINPCSSSILVGRAAEWSTMWATVADSIGCGQQRTRVILTRDYCAALGRATSRR